MDTKNETTYDVAKLRYPALSIASSADLSCALLSSHLTVFKSLLEIDPVFLAKLDFHTCHFKNLHVGCCDYSDVQ